MGVGAERRGWEKRGWGCGEGKGLGQREGVGPGEKGCRQMGLCSDRKEWGHRQGDGSKGDRVLAERRGGAIDTGWEKRG